MPHRVRGGGKRPRGAGRASPASLVRPAKATVADAEDEVAAAMSAHARLLARQGEFDADIVGARNELVAAADAVLIAERAAPALQQAEDALAQLLQARRILQAIFARGALFLRASMRDQDAYERGLFG
jgi:hypothetical protein